MQRRLISLITKIGLPMIVGQFAAEWTTKGLETAARDLPMRAVLMLAVLVGWAAFREHQERNRRPFH